MARNVAVCLLLLASAVGQDMTKKQCRENLKTWLPMMRAVYESAECQGGSSPACPFVAPIRGLSSNDLGRLVYDADSCAKRVRNKHDRFYLQRVATRAENVIVMRAAAFLDATNQRLDYLDWEDTQRSPETKGTVTDAANTQRK